MMGIDDSTDLTLTDITQNNLDGDTNDSTAAANTDAFDVGSSTGVAITGATINNQDDCLVGVFLFRTIRRRYTPLVEQC